MAEVSIGDILIDGLVDRLTIKLRDEPDDIKVRTIRAGRLQDDPTVLDGLNILVQDDTDTEPATLATPGSGGRLGAPAHLIGGSSFYFLRIRMQMIFHFKGERIRSTARSKAMTLLGRLKHAIATMNMPTHPTTGQPRDDFGEVVISVEIDTHSLKESGGEGHFIWKGEMDVKFLTEYSPT